MAAPKLHPAEAKVRAQFADDLERQANLPGIERDIATAMRVRADKVRNALPYLDFQRALAALRDARDTELTGMAGLDQRFAAGEAERKLKEDNLYPLDFSQAVDQALLRASVDDIDLYVITGIPNPAAEKSKASEPLTAGQITELVEKELARQLALPGHAAFRKDLDARLGARFE